MSRITLVRAMGILIAEDDLDISTLYKRALEKRKHVVVLTSTGEACLQNYIDTLRTETTPRFSSVSMTTPIVNLSSTPQDIKFHNKRTSSFDTDVSSLYDVVILDYKMPGMNGMDVAKEILAVNLHQRIIFASAYVKETLQESVKQLKQIVELMQKPFTLSQLVDTVEDKEVYEELKSLNVDVNRIRAAEPTHELVIDLLERLRRIQKNRTF
jgi:two-component system, chemotaxis family, chemotaxis protein CheY